MSEESKRQSKILGRYVRKLNRQKTKTVIGLDGEGWTDNKGRHHYAYMAACSAWHKIGEIDNPNGLSSKQIFEFLLSLPKDSIFVGFSLGYDITKWLEDLPDSTLFLLNHPELRPGKLGPRPLRWNAYSINRISTRFDIARVGESRYVIWDLFKFFGKAFVPALKDWRVGSTTQWDLIQSMKDKRGDFQGIEKEEKQYCQLECKLLAQLAMTLFAAHRDAEIPLAQYFGPGSTASTMLKKMGAKDQTAKIPKEMEFAVESAFFGGRFEISRAGPIEKVYSYDIASAYPFAMTQLPCLAHGKWELRKKPTIHEIEQSSTSCIHYHLPFFRGYQLNSMGYAFDKNLHDVTKQWIDIQGKAVKVAWGPFPFRCKDGNIIFPIASSGGWIWKDEYLIAIKHFPNVECSEAWILNQDCSCGKPFARQVAEYYNRRLEWGKEGRGIALKLGVNSCYGKRAQRVGNAPYRCGVSAGLITSRTRAMLLEAIASAKNPWSIVSVATDGIQSTEPLSLANPPHTGTEETAKAKGKFPLGAWESKKQSDQHMIRPGMRFSPCLADETETTAARGLGVRVLHKSRGIVLEAWNRKPMGDVYLQQPTLFSGIKGSIRASDQARRAMARVLAGLCDWHDIAPDCAGQFTRDAKLGTWVTPEPRLVSYNSLPKRPWYEPDSYRMLSWVLSQDVGESVPYGKASIARIVQELLELQNIEENQPDANGFHTLEPLDA